MKVDPAILEKEIQNVFKKLPNICCDIASHLFILQSLLDAYKKLTGKDLSTDY